MWQPTTFSSAPAVTSFMRVFGLCVRDAVVERDELRGIDLHAGAEALAGRRLAETAGADGRVAENDRGNVRVVEMAGGLAAEDPVGRAATGGNRHRRERFPAGDVPQRVDVRDVGHLEIIRRDETPGVSRTPAAGRLRSAVQGSRPTAQNTASKGPWLLPSAEVSTSPAACRAQGRRDRLPDNLDAVVRQGLQQALLQVGIKVAQDTVLADEQRDIRAERPQGPGKLHGDVARAGDGHPLGPDRELEEVIGHAARVHDRECRALHGRPPVATMTCLAVSIRPPASTVWGPEKRPRAAMWVMPFFARFRS